MSSVKEIEMAVAKLSREELATFRNWFVDFDAEVRDRQFETDATAGRLDALAKEPLNALNAGRSLTSETPIAR